jgi:hypothetical protein
MILVPGQFIYLAAPRTGSRTTTEALLKHCGGIKQGREHHSRRDELETLNTKLPVYSVIREPFDFVMSAWARALEPTMEMFLEFWKSDCLDEWDGRMTPYDGFVDHYYLFENGLEDFFERVGFGGVPLTNKGRYETPPYKPLAQGDEQMVRERFAADFERYEYWRERNAVL